MDRMIDDPTLESLASSFDITPETLGGLLIFYPVTGSGLNNDIELPPEIADLSEREDQGEKLTKEEDEKLRNGLATAVAYDVFQYLNTIEKDPDKYRPEIRKVIDALTEDRKEGETVDACLNRHLKKGGIVFSVTTKTESPKEEDALLAQPYVSLLNSELINVLFGLSLDKFTEDPITHVATYEKDGNKIEIKNADKLQTLTPNQLGLFDTAVAYLTENNYISSDGKPIPRESINTTVEIPLVDYARATGKSITPQTKDTRSAQVKEDKRARDEKRTFKGRLRKDLDILTEISIAGIVEKGKSAGNYKAMPLILNNPSVNDNYITVHFDDQLAYLLVNAHIMQYSPKLLRLNGSNPSNMRIGRALLLHASMYNNRKRGTELTLTVKSIVGSTPAIPGLDELEKREKKHPGKILSNWKNLVKTPTEKTLNNLINGEIIKRWEYRDPSTGDTITPEQIQRNKNVSLNEYLNLRVDYVLTDDLPEMP